MVFFPDPRSGYLNPYWEYLDGIENLEDFRPDGWYTSTFIHGGKTRKSVQFWGGPYDSKRVCHICGCEVVTENLTCWACLDKLADKAERQEPVTLP